MQSTLTFSQQIVAGDSWGQATVPLIEEYPLTAIYFLCVFLSVGFAVMNLILGVVVNVASAEHDRLKGEIEDEKQLNLMEGREELLRICQDMDADGSGELSKTELLSGYKERQDFRDAVSYLDLREEDMGIAFAGMDTDKNGQVSYPEFVKKIFKMKESDQAFLLEQLKYHILKVADIVNDNHAALMEHPTMRMGDSDTVIKGREVPGSPSKTSDKVDDKYITFMEGVQAYPLPADQLEENTKMTMQTLEGSARTLEGSATGMDSRVADAVQAIVPKDTDGTGKELLDAILNISQVFRGELSASLRHIESSLEQQANNTSRMLHQIGPRAGDDLVALPRNAMAPPPNGCLPTVTAPLCCRV
jgi:hypothetical protein